MKSRLAPDQRLHPIDIPLIGLTGGIASGKSSVAQILSRRGAAVIAADKLIKQIYAQESTKDFIRKNFSPCIKGEKIDFPLLRQKVFQNNQARDLLENFLHPHLPEFFAEAFKKFSSPNVVVYDLPLLFEKSLQKRFDMVVCVYCTRQQQAERLVARDGIDENLAMTMLKKQMDIETKKAHADVVIDNTSDTQRLKEHVLAFIDQHL